MKARNPNDERTAVGRRRFLQWTAGGLGALAAQWMLGAQANGVSSIAPKAKRAIWLFMAGAPSQLDLFDHKPGLLQRFNQDVPPSVLGDQRLTTMTSMQGRFPVAPSRYRFTQVGQAGTWVSELLPWTQKIMDEVALIRSVHHESINHEPAMLNVNTGNQLPGKASVGSWLSYGLGSLSNDLPTYVVMTSKFSSHINVQALSSRLWASGPLPAVHSGVTFRGVGDPVLYASLPPGVDVTARRAMLDGLAGMNGVASRVIGDPGIQDRVEQYELAFRMQSSLPALVDVSGESAATRALYGPEVDERGTFASNCLLARRMIERGVRFVQIYHRGWDAHAQLPENHSAQCRDIDQACYGLITDLKQRGLLEDTLVIWGGEFGRTVYGQGGITRDDYGRDHHPRCFSMWMAGGGVKPGVVHGETDDYSYNVVRDPVHLRDLHATMLHLFGIDPRQLSVTRAGLPERLIGVEGEAKVVHGILR